MQAGAGLQRAAAEGQKQHVSLCSCFAQCHGESTHSSGPAGVRRSHAHVKGGVLGMGGGGSGPLI